METTIPENAFALGAEENKVLLENVTPDSYFISAGNMIYKFINRIDASDISSTCSYWVWPPESDWESVLATKEPDEISCFEREISFDHGDEWVWVVGLVEAEEGTSEEVAPPQNEVEPVAAPDDTEKLFPPVEELKGIFDVSGLEGEVEQEEVSEPAEEEEEIPDLADLIRGRGVVDQENTELPADDELEPSIPEEASDEPEIKPLAIHELAKELGMPCRNLGEIAVAQGIIDHLGKGYHQTRLAPADAELLQIWVKEDRYEDSSVVEDGEEHENGVAEIPSTEPEAITEPPVDEKAVDGITIPQEKLEAVLGLEADAVNVELVIRKRINIGEIDKLKQVARLVLGDDEIDELFGDNND